MHYTIKQSCLNFSSMCTISFPLWLYPFILHLCSSLLHQIFLLRHTIANPSPPNHFHAFNFLMLSVSPTRSFFQSVSWYLRLSFPLSSLTLFSSPFFIPNSLYISITCIQHVIFRNLPLPSSLSFCQNICSLPCCKISLGCFVKPNHDFSSASSLTR